MSSQRTPDAVSDADDLFPGFSTHDIDVGGVRIHARAGGAGPPLLLLHGYPQTHAMWHRVAPRLAQSFTVVAADLRGYGRSSCPPSDASHRPYSKRTMARDMAALMRLMGHGRFVLLGHGGGARVAYRLALDQPASVGRMVILDVVTTADYWAIAKEEQQVLMCPWAFLAQPAPLPESLIGRNPARWIEGRLTRGTRQRSLDAIDPRALAEYTACFGDPDHIHATCEDYRAGAQVDLADDEADRAAGRRIAAPTLVLWGTAGPLAGIADPLALWRPWCDTVSGLSIDSGHFIAEENPQALLAAALPFLGA